MARRILLMIAVLLAMSTTVVGADEHENDEGDDSRVATVGWAENDEVGIYLTDPEGMTLYVFENDRRGEGRSNCTGDCATNWPPFTAEEPLALPEGVPGELTLIEREDGTQQVAYNGMPLYLWVNDEAPGDITGHGVGNNWVVASVSADGATPVAQASPTASGDDQVAVELGEFYVAPETTTLQAGVEYTFVVTNAGVLIHEMVIERAGSVDEPLETEDGDEAEIEDIAPGTTAELTFAFEEPGQYQLSCHIPGHFENGMVVEITVEG